MDLVTVGQSILDATGNGTYLEIGVSAGNSFIPIRASRKWGVDPSYTLTRRRRTKYALFSLLGIKVERLFRMRSDEFFAAHARMLSAHGIDVCLVDGLHTYEQSLKDVLNALAYLKPRGVILLHDCNPSTELMALPASGIDELITRRIPGWNGAWTGDVWKTIVHLRSLRDDVDAFVVDCDTGIGVVTKGRPSGRLPYAEAEIREMDYRVLETSRTKLLGLRSTEYFREFTGETSRTDRI